jgi:acetyl-CoA acyltransferase
MPSSLSNGREVVFVDGCRIPFQQSGTGYAELMAYDMGRMALKGLLTRTDLDPAEVDRVVMGSVVQDVNTSNVAREAALGAGFPNEVPAFTVTMACISSNQALTSGAELIAGNQAEIVVAGGTEILSDPPIRLQPEVRRRLFQSRRAKTPGDYLELLKGLSPSDILPEAPSIAEYSTGEVMGESADKLAAMFDVPRREQDEYALRSHQKAAEARDAGHLAKELVPTSVPPDFEPIAEDNGIRDDTSLEKLEKLPPAFVKPFGTVAAGNSSPLTDGASAALVMSAEKADALGYEPQAVLREYTYVAQDPGDELLLGPAYAMPQVLDAAGLSVDDIDVFELHEAFAGQVLAVLRASESKKFAKETRDGAEPMGAIPMEKLNTWGGSLSLGHPFGATGTRLVTTAAHRLHAEDGQFALVSACAAGGQGHALLLERS